MEKEQYAFTMVLKKHLDEVTEDRVVMLSKILINKLKRLITDMNKSKLYDKKELDSFICDLEEIYEAFKRIINGEISDCIASFNSCIALLKKLSKCPIIDDKGNILKLLWIK